MEKGEHSCVHYSHGFTNRRKSTHKKHFSLYKFAERHPFYVWILTLTMGLTALFGCFGLSGHIDWKMIAYCCYILLCIIVYIVIAIVYLRKFGKELQIELEGAIVGQICRPTRKPSSARRESGKLNQIFATASSNRMGTSRKASTVAFRETTEIMTTDDDEFDLDCTQAFVYEEEAVL